MEVNSSEYFRDNDNKRYRKTTNHMKKIWWAVEHNNEWFPISGHPSREVNPE